MKKQTVIDQIEVSRDGSIQIRIAREIVDDDGTIIDSKWHRTALPPGHDADAQMATVNDHLTKGLNSTAIQQADIDRVKAVAAVAWTDEAISAYQAKLAASLPQPPA